MSPRPVSASNSSWTPSSWTPATYRPPMLCNRGPELGLAPAAAAGAIWPWVVRLGVPLLVSAGVIYASSSLVKAAVPSVPINTRNVPKAAILGGLGVASYYATGLLPEKWAPVGYIGAALGVASSIYFLFKDVPVGADPSAPTPAVAPEAYAAIRPLIEEPKRGQTTTPGVISDAYPVRVMWVNAGDIAVPFNYRFSVTETPSGSFGAGPRTSYIVNPKSSDPELKPINRLTLMPKDSIPVTYELPVQTTMTGWVAANVDLSIEVFNPHALGWVRVAGPHSFIVRRI